MRWGAPNNMELSLLAPLRLAILVPLLAVIGLCWLRSSLPRRSWTAMTQLLMAGVLTIALADIVTSSVDQMSRGDSTVFVQDASDSMNATPAFATDVDADASVSFKASALVGSSETGGDLDDGSDLAIGVVAGASQGASSVLLRSDGRETSGSLLAAVKNLDSPLFAFAPPKLNDMRIVNVQTTPNRPDRSIDLTIIVESNVAAEATLTIQVDKKPTELPVSVSPGLNSFVSSSPALGRDRATIEVELASEADGESRNNRFRADWRSSLRAKVAIVHSVPAQRASLDAELSRLGLQPIGWSVDDVVEEKLKAIDCLVLLSDAAKLNARQQKTVEQFAAQGGGVVVVGGASVYGAEALQASQWKSWLPVSESTSTQKTSRPSFAMVLVIDKSESMQYENRLNMAKQAARQAVELLDQADQVGVLAFGTSSKWVSEIAPSGDKKTLLSRIAELQVEGETNMYPAIERAQLALEQVDVEHKNLILLTDGISSPGDFGEVAQRLKSSGISVATVSVSTGAEQLVLKDIARIASGRHYHCDDPNELPNVLVRAARQAVAKIGPNRFSVFELEGGFENVPMQSSPPLTGVVETSPKDDTVLAYLTDDGQPLIVWRKHEAGTVASIVCDSDSLLNAEWTKWPGFESFWRAVVSTVEREPAQDPITIGGRFHGSRFELRIDLVDGQRWDSNASVSVVLDSAGSNPIPAPLSAPGHYVATLPFASGNPSITGEVIVRRGTLELRRNWRFYENYGAEFRHVGADLELLRSAALASRGAMIESLADVPETAIETETSTVSLSRALWCWLVVIAIVLLVAETFQRRWTRRFGVL